MDFIFEATDDFQKLQCVQAPSERAFQRLKNAFKKYKKNAYMSSAVRRGFVDGRVSFFDDVYLPIGLWGELANYMNENNFTYEFRYLDLFLNNKIERDEVTTFMNDLFDGVSEIPSIRWYQYESVYLILKYRYCSQQISTAAGKTMISYAVAAWFKKNGVVSPKSKFLMIVPRKELSSQTHDKFVKYDNGLVPMSVCHIGGDGKFDEDVWNSSDVVISTFQSLQNIPDEYFKSIGVINVDEAHTARTASIRHVIEVSSPLKYRFGLSGTLKVHTSNAEYFENIQQLGPVVFEYNPDDLISDGFAPEVHIDQVTIDYTEYISKHEDQFAEYRNLCDRYKFFSSPSVRGCDEALKFYKTFYSIEKQMVCEDENRLDAIINYINTNLDKKKNILVLFNDVKGSFGKKICDRMNETKTTHYIDGSTKNGDRSKFKDSVEEKNVNLVASFGTFSTGIDLKNIHYIIFAESYKSPILIGQSIGRGLRSHKSKKVINIIDFVDSMYKHTVKHADERMTIYHKFKYDVTKSSIKI